MHVVIAAEFTRPPRRLPEGSSLRIRTVLATLAATAVAAVTLPMAAQAAPGNTVVFGDSLPANPTVGDWLTAKGAPSDKVQGLDCGADDYKVKPFSPCELMASIRVIVSRHGMQQAPMAFSGLVIDPAGRTVTADGMRLALTARNTICSSIWP